jgi:hypothetical protein
MIVGGFALAAYSWKVAVLFNKFLMSSWSGTTAALVVFPLTELRVGYSALAEFNLISASARELADALTNRLWIGVGR